MDFNVPRSRPSSTPSIFRWASRGWIVGGLAALACAAVLTGLPTGRGPRTADGAAPAAAGKGQGDAVLASAVTVAPAALQASAADVARSTARAGTAAVVPSPTNAKLKPVPLVFPFRTSDAVAFVGSSSTAIGTWPKGVEFLLRTRHPELNLTFVRDGIGGATFASAADRVDNFLSEKQPAVVVFNFGANDAAAGEKGLAGFERSMRQCVESAQHVGAKVLLVTPQCADTRRSGVVAAAKRALYADDMLAVGRRTGWSVVDIHHPLAVMLSAAQAVDKHFTINRDSIHLTDASYVAWAFYLYQSLQPPKAVSAATLAADGRCLTTRRCKIEGMKVRGGVLSFTRRDEVLPILPPTPLPPSQWVPLEACSQYRLAVEGLPHDGAYEVSCDGSVLGTATAEELAVGVNLNHLLLVSGRTAPWLPLARRVWAGETLREIGPTAFHFEVRRAETDSPEALPVIGPLVRQVRAEWRTSMRANVASVSSGAISGK